MNKVYIGFDEVTLTIDDLEFTCPNDPEDVTVTIQVTDPNTNGHYDIALEDLIDKAGLK